MTEPGDHTKPAQAGALEKPRSSLPPERVEQELLRCSGVVKTFGGVHALDHVDFDLNTGEVHILFGENGAGKSTFINILAGAFRPDDGEIDLSGERVVFESVYDARQQGISAVFQEFSLTPDLTVEENIFLGHEPIRATMLDKRAIREAAREIIERLGFSIDPQATVSGLSRALQQMVEIAKALLTDPKILILDEPTSSLTEREVGQLFRLIEQLKAHLLIRDAPPVGMYVLNMFRMRGSRLWGSRLHRACVV